MSAMNSMAAKQSRDKKLVDPVFSILAKAKEAASVYGEEAVVNGTIGSIQDDDGQLATLDKVTELIRSYPPEKMMSYAPISGVPGFEQAAIEFTFGKSKPDAYVGAIATPGGTGAIRHVVSNYADSGSYILIPDWRWGPYKVIAKELGCQVDMYSLFTPEFNFNLTSFQEKVKSNLEQQDNLVIIFNTPAHNPTGYTISRSEWREILAFVTETGRQTDKKIVLLLDVAYIDYAGDFEEVREFFKLLEGLPHNVMVTVASSMSKSFLAYGMRCGALVGISASEEVIKEFKDMMSYSTRANWSNVNRLPQELLVDVYNDPELLSAIIDEREAFRKLVENRGQVFVKEAAEVNLEICPYYAGFFIAIPCNDPQGTVERLQEERIFAVPLSKGIRLAVCSIPTAQMTGLAAKVKKMI